jgi:NADH-quinone oxidoreductase subunit A
LGEKEAGIGPLAAGEVTFIHFRAVVTEDGSHSLQERHMLFDLTTVLVFILAAAVFIVFNLLLGKLLRPRKPDAEKLSTYECGIEPIGSAYVQFNIRFYVIALVFIIFDVEIALLYPWVTVFNDPDATGQLIALIKVAIFVGNLFVGFVYVWVKGDLDWVMASKTVVRGQEQRKAG